MSGQENLKCSQLTTNQLRYSGARKIVATGPVALGITKWGKAVLQLREDYHRRLSKESDSVPFDEKSPKLSEDMIPISIDVPLASKKNPAFGEAPTNPSACEPLSTEKVDLTDASTITAGESDTDTETEASDVSSLERSAKEKVKESNASSPAKLESCNDGIN